MLTPGGVDGARVETSDLTGAYDAHALDVFAFCLRRCGDRTEAEDLLSIVFLEAWRCPERAVLVDGTWRPWLLGIASNGLRNAARSRRRHQATTADGPGQSHDSRCGRRPERSERHRDSSEPR
jgi:DNA-directed RNA polymerase specialized sigma24 family protein